MQARDSCRIFRGLASLRSPVLSLVLALSCLVPSARAAQPRAGNSLQSCLDVLVANQRGSAIVIDPATGQVLAAWDLQSAVSDAYPPGSAAKIVEAAAALEEGVLAPGDRIACRGVPPLLGASYRCAHPPAREGFTLRPALANSCNYFFAAVSLRLSAEALLHWYSVFGFGTAVTLDGNPTAPGRLSRASGARSKALEAVGSEGVLATPAQLLEAYCLIANRGGAPRLWTDASPRSSAPERQIKLRPTTYGAILGGLVDCVRSGTCQAAAVPGVEVAGKTGTATALDGSGATHAWFAGFAPAERPRIALVIFLDRGTGARNAAPLAGRLLRHFFAGGQQARAITPLAAPAREFRVRAESGRAVTVDLDAYVEGVVAGEASVLRNRAALQAVAILARTWALGHRDRHRSEGYDFCSLTHCQVFRLPGAKGYSPAIVDAVLSTRHQVLEYEGKLADPYFTADCGGVSESAAAVWPDRNLPYLLSAPDPYCAASPHSSWQHTITFDQVAAVLRHQLRLEVRVPVVSLTVDSRDASGRARTLSVIAGARFIVDANQFRYAMGREVGWDTLKSDLYTVEARGNTVVFHGRGLGHGVGLCQAGADAMAGLGLSYRQILSHYFPGVTVVESSANRGVESDPVASSEHFELAYPDAQKPWVSHTLSTLEAWRRALADQGAPVADRVRVETWNTTAEFIDTTGEPGFAAGSTDGRSIYLQPLATLAAKKVLDSTLRHELTHLALDRLRAPVVPNWFEEGLVLYLTGESFTEKSVSGDPRMNASGNRTLGQALARPRSSSEMRAAYARSALLVQHLASARGPTALWQILRKPASSDVDWLRSEDSKPLDP